MSQRKAEVSRKTRETTVEGSLVLDGTGEADVSTGIGFLDHMIKSFVFHARFDLRLAGDGDLNVDDHHTTEDCGIVLGTLLQQALGDYSGIERFGHAYAPLDEALARAVVDLSGRPHATTQLGLTRERVGELSCENVSHFIRSMSIAARATVHVDVLRGENDHHRVEAAFKAMALAMKAAVASTAGGEVRSTKGLV